MSDREKIAVYGTLKKGFANHALIAAEEFVGATTLTEICLYDIGPYPAARKESSLGIEVEVYAVSPVTLSRLDVLEEYDPVDPLNSLYTRELFPTCFGAAWVYLYQPSADDKPRQSTGSWCGSAAAVASLKEETS